MNAIEFSKKYQNIDLIVFKNMQFHFWVASFLLAYLSLNCWDEKKIYETILKSGEINDKNY